MENAQIIQLQADIAHLNQLLKVLIVENAEIKAEIAHLKSWIGTPQANIAHPKVDVGNIEANIAHLKSEVGSYDTNNAHLKNYVGTPQANIANPKSYVGNIEAGNDNAKNEMGNLDPNTALPEMITDTSGIRGKLVQYLISQKVAGSNRQAIKASAQLIIHIYNKKPCSYTELQKLTGLSKFGIAKRIRALKKEGFIASNGYQSFTLSTKTLQILQQIVAGK